MSELNYLRERVEFLEEQLSTSKKVKEIIQLNEWDKRACPARCFISSRAFNVCNKDIAGDDYCRRHCNGIRNKGVLRDGDVRITGQYCLPCGVWSRHDKWMKMMDFTLGPYQDMRPEDEQKRYPDIVRRKNEPTYLTN